LPKHRILIIDDDALMREFAEEAMIRAGYVVETASSGPAALKVFDARVPDIVITDLKMAPMDGLAVLRAIKERSPDTHVILMTGYGTIETAVSALKEGAIDYILKPFTPDIMATAVARALAHARLTQENRYLREQVSAAYDVGSMVGGSSPMKVVHEQIVKVADSRATILIRGASGTGKELVARALHYGSTRKDKTFVKVNCAALSAGILESELFGHEKGAFTGAHSRKIGRFELADGGTLLLDEVSEIPLELQAKLLRALQEREFERVGGTDTIQVDTRLIATTNRPLEQAVAEGKFREDLFFRLNVIAIQLPPLRDRMEDIPALLEHFLQRSNRENGRSVKGFTREGRDFLLAYDWPGNVRELQNAVERAVVLSSEDYLTPQSFQLAGKDLPRSGPSAGLEAGMTVAEAEQQLIFTTLSHCADNRTKAAEMLGISVRTLRNKLKEYGAQDEDGEES